MAEDLDKTRALLQRWHRGDRGGLDALLERDLPWLRAHVRQRLGDELRAVDESVDVVQDAMVDVLRYGPRFVVSDQHRFRALLAKIVENNLRDRGGWMRAARRAANREQPIPDDSCADLDPVGDVTRPSQAADRRDRHHWVRLALEMLDAEDRQLIRLRQFEERSFEEVGRELGVSADAARMRFSRALPRLAEVMRRLRSS